MIGRFLRWWAKELGSLIPSSLKRLLAPRPAAIVARMEGEEISLSLHRRRRRVIGMLGMLTHRAKRQLMRGVAEGRAETVLALPRDLVLHREVALPLAAEQTMTQVMRYEIDRVTPFAVEEIFYAHRIQRRDAAAGTLILDLFFVPRDQVEAPLEALRCAGLPAARLDLLDTDGRPSSLNLLPPEVKGAWTWRGRLAAGLALLCLILGATQIGVTLNQREARAEALRAEVAEARRTAIARQETSAAASASDPLTIAAFELKRQSPSALEILATVTEILPDDTYLEVLDLQGARLHLTGQSQDASRLLVLLEGHLLFAEPAFSAPITRNREEGGERFSLSLEIARPEVGQ